MKSFQMKLSQTMYSGKFSKVSIFGNSLLSDVLKYFQKSHLDLSIHIEQRIIGEFQKSVQKLPAIRYNLYDPMSITIMPNIVPMYYFVMLHIGNTIVILLP